MDRIIQTSLETGIRTMRTGRALRILVAGAAVALVVGLAGGSLAGSGPDPAGHLEAARDLVFAERPEAALKEVRRALAELGEDGSPELRLRALTRAAQITDFHLGDSRGQEALGWYKRVIEAAPQSTEAFDAGVRMAELLRERFDDPTRAEEQLLSVVDAFKQNPGAPRLLLRTARYALEAGRNEAARGHGERLLRDYPTSDEVPDTLALVGSTLHLDGKHGEAVKAYETLAERFPGTVAAARALHEAGNCHAEQGDYSHAIARYLAALPTHPDPMNVQRSLERVRRTSSAQRAMAPGSKAVAFR